MKKAILLLVVAAICGAAQATILRVNNNAGSGAPYSNVTDAIEASSAGDTIMIDQSATSYGDITVSKKLVIMGPGYWRVENGISSEGASSAQLAQVTINRDADGLVLRGVTVTGLLTVNAPNVVVNRCNLIGVKLSETATRCVIHQNFIAHSGVASGVDAIYGPASYTQITNNIIIQSDSYQTQVSRINEGYIAYNTFAFNQRESRSSVLDCTNCTVEKNIARVLTPINSCSYDDNYVYAATWIYTDRTTDKTIRDQRIEDSEIRAGVTGRGAFAGDDPYVLSGIPAGPMIEDVTVPASVEQGNTLNVTIKLGVQK